ncbi:class I SAM-dependent methyltransferase [Persicirhabdus sediminis]|uniref:Class I SAM-dependent methyltransferase n=1 Tax=Persicirhabdus sediminis TaxID=454144 RepID=A0A8J7MGV3_9BACT|nr:class I SAM-dependent methyltransferase [Persicirhabdus sediminis]MBK1792616.1 class I SAM-dependent methyltransferase [Persicirhabdus sediminis]
MNFDAVAPIYQLMERVVFGHKLQLARCAHLPASLAVLAGGESAKILVIGDGDGRFAAQLAEEIVSRGIDEIVRVDVVELSQGMCAELRHRLASYPFCRVHCADVRDWRESDYQLVFCHFVLDLYRGSEFDQWIEILDHLVQSAGYLVVTDFENHPDGGIFATCLLRVMYQFFHYSAGIPVGQLEGRIASMDGLNAELVGEFSQLNGFVQSRLWRKI